MLTFNSNIMKVHLRQRQQTTNGKISLYLEYYMGTTTTKEGKIKPLRKYEYLNLFLFSNPKNQNEKAQNNKIKIAAEKRLSERRLEIINDEFHLKSNYQKGNFIEYFKYQLKKKEQYKGSYGIWNATLKHLIKYTGDKLLFKEIDKTFIEGFVDYLLNDARMANNQKLTPSTAKCYYSKLKACINQAIKENIIHSNPGENIIINNQYQHKREYLTLEEVRKIVKTECRYKELKKAFLFSCLTGLRWSDIEKLKWSEVQKTENGYKIVFHQQKTKGLQYLDISEQAREYLGSEGMPQEKVFTNLKYSVLVNNELLKWVQAAGIKKKITFHCARHTFATLQLTVGTDLYTLSKLLGHTDIKTTQIYANIIDEKKREAVNRIPDINI
jgi:integrase